MIHGLPLYTWANNPLPFTYVNRKVWGRNMCMELSPSLSPRSAGPVFLTEVRLTSARRGLSPPASWVETCSCPRGYTGQFCESCALGYKRETPLGGPYASCVPCTCNQHGTCDPNTGESPCIPPTPARPPGHTEQRDEY